MQNITMREAREANNATSALAQTVVQVDVMKDDFMLSVEMFQGYYALIHN
jgi:hypothetical protein